MMQGNIGKIARRIRNGVSPENYKSHCKNYAFTITDENEEYFYDGEIIHAKENCEIMNDTD